MATYVNDLRLKEIGTGESSGTWGTETNVNLELIGEALGYGTEGITTNADTHTTTVADGSTDPGRAMYIEYTGTLDSACTITIAPNTLSRLHYIENGTSGSQNIIIKQGSGATVTIPPGDTKAVYLDGAGSGAKVVDVFASFSVVDLKVQDDLTVTDDATVGGTLGVTGILTCTDDIIIGDGKTIGSASDVDAMTIASNGQVTFTQTLIGTALDISGDIDVDGTANLDIVDIDGATNIAAAVTMATNNKIQFRDDAIHISSTADGQLDLVADTEIQIAATTIDVNGNLDVSGTTVSAGKITADAGIDIDNINIDGTTIALSSGNLTLDVAGDIILDADGQDVIFKDGGTQFGSVRKNGNNIQLMASIQDGDITFHGDDGGSDITALTLDMSAAGEASFNAGIKLTDGNAASFGTGGDLLVYHSSNENIIQTNTSDQDLLFKGNDGGSSITALTLDMSDSGAATLRSTIATGSGGASGKIAIAGNTATSEATHITFTNGAGAKVFAVGGGQSGVTNNGFVIRNVTDNTFPLVISDASAATFAAGVVVTGNTQSASLTVGTANDEGEALNIRDGGHTGHGAANTVSLASFAENVSGNSAGVWLGSMTNENTAVIGTRTATGNLGFQTYNGSAWGERMRIDNIGRVTKPAQPAFQAEPTSTQTDIAINGFVEVVLGTERIDVGSNFASNTFTAPVTGKYQLSANIRLNNIDSAASYYQMRISTSNEDYYSIFDPDFGQDNAFFSFGSSILADMDASDTAKVEIIQLGGTAQTDIHGDTKFSGYLVA